MEPRAYLRWNLIGQLACKQRDRDSENEGGRVDSGPSLLARAERGTENLTPLPGMACANRTRQDSRGWRECLAPDCMLPLSHSIEVFDVGPPVKGQRF